MARNFFFWYDSSVTTTSAYQLCSFFLDIVSSFSS